MENKIIIALDGITEKKALSIALKLKRLVWGFKVNDLIFGSPKIISKLKKLGKVFADAKLHDIPSTVGNSTAKLSKIGADMITVHASGGVEMMKAAKMHAGQSKVLAVTILTSRNTVNKKEFLELIADTKKAKLDGIVCSANELKYLKNYKFLKVVPGIRPAWYKKKDDQKHTVTPAEALRLGADYLVIGRPILNAKDPMKALENI